ncbi:aldo/keto reductase [Lutimonas sp.]|uniref:aldo/keto reductase n=1 Tax=Lutimonas sp. TaxID=1872403 RepID=UPI003D9AEB5F
MKNTSIGLGLAALGRPEYINIRKTEDSDKSKSFYLENTLNVLDFAYDQGVRHFDTAPSYGLGESYLKQWNEKKRSEHVKLSTKWGYTYMADWKLGYTGKHEIKEHSLEKLKEQWAVSKKLLPALKLYQIHSATLESGVFKNKEVLKQLYELKKETGLLIGATTSGANQDDVLRLAAEIKVNNEYLFDSFQVTFNILESSTFELLSDLILKGRIIYVKEALANGRIFRNVNFPQYDDLYQYLDVLAEKYKVGVDAIALRFVIDYLSPEVVLSGASTEGQLQENMKAMNFSLEKQELISLRKHACSKTAYWNERQNLTWN